MTHMETKPNIHVTIYIQFNLSIHKQPHLHIFAEICVCTNVLFFFILFLRMFVRAFTYILTLIWHSKRLFCNNKHVSDDIRRFVVGNNNQSNA